ncbi:MAG: 2-oxoacid:acceptor oxidoreductase family protein [Clostridiales bacterium]|jgi:2-oxoglutarate ferredoxin oxidoreductase subunit gamma|nr:2-oxoacid:acceptor oxidoreductase family protein [Clostridiales bacterium]
MEHGILLAGFGGQGILFAGKVLAQTGLICGKNVSWLPSYGPEMRGGTANCNVIISDSEVSSPIVTMPQILVCMNGPSYAKFAESTQKGGYIFVDGAMVGDDELMEPAGEITQVSIPASQMSKLANMVLIGCMVRVSELATWDELEEGLKKAVPARKREMLDANLSALKLGWDFC